MGAYTLERTHLIQIVGTDFATRLQGTITIDASRIFELKEDRSSPQTQLEARRLCLPRSRRRQWCYFISFRKIDAPIIAPDAINSHSHQKYPRNMMASQAPVRGTVNPKSHGQAARPMRKIWTDYGADGGTRTRKDQSPRDFKSLASTSFATSAACRSIPDAKLRYKPRV